jgi:hypothetical protein
MTRVLREIELAERLRHNPVLRLKGYSVNVEPRGGVIIDRAGHVRGIWHYRWLCYHWTPAGYNQATYAAPVAEAAESYTLQTLDIH